MLVTPDYKVHPLRYHGLVHAVLGPPAQVPVLVEGEDVEPGLGLFSGLRLEVGGGAKKRYLLLGPHTVQALVAHGAHAIKGHLRLVPLPQQYGADCDLVHFVMPAVVVHQVRRGQDVERGEHVGATVAGGVVVVAVYGKDGEIDAKVGVLIVHSGILREVLGLVRKDLHVDRVRAQAVLPQYADGLEDGRPRRLVVVEKVTRQQHEVGALHLGEG
mmetsp:Transcript_26805/g.55991  ORF Transcript_26805/g.55991 Transcript_26805/m.55991 type:complete len:215 (-) Transcript_26805:188-832(-)